MPFPMNLRLSSDWTVTGVDGIKRYLHLCNTYRGKKQEYQSHPIACTVVVHTASYYSVLQHLQLCANSTRS